MPRNFRQIFFWLLFSCAAASALAADERTLAKGISFGAYGTNWPRCVFLKSTESRISVAITPNIGGRIVAYSLNDENILFDGAVAGRKNMAGGYQCDVGPETLDLP